MKLLLDQNLSPRLVARLADIAPAASHVALLGLDRALDREVHAHAREHGFVIVTKDADFGDLGLTLGFPPSIVWIRRGNCSTDEIEALLRTHAEAIRALAEGPGGVLALY